MTTPRLSSLDQFRGYTVLGMFLVNFVGGKEHVPAILGHHHTYCSYADTIMPQFLLAVGFGMRLSFLRRRQVDGTAATYRHFVWRCLGLILLGIVVYHLTGGYRSWAELTAQAQQPANFLLRTFKRHPFEALTHIGVTVLWVLPVIAAPGWARALFAVGSAGLHVWVSHAGYYEWNLADPKGIDGGPLGFLTWSVLLVLGTLAHDWVVGGQPWWLLALVGAVVAALGYYLSLLNRFTPPNDITAIPSWEHIHDGFPFTGPGEWFAPNYWTMSQRAGSVSYLTFAAGFGLTVYALFRVVCDRYGVRWGYLDLLGRHALAGYVIHDLVAGVVQPFVPKDSPGWWVWVAFGVYLGVVTVFLRYLDRNRLYLKL